MNENCEKCKLHLKCNSHKVPVLGRGKKKILIVLDNPSKATDLQPDKFVGGDLGTLNYYLRPIDLTRDCWITYAARCHTQNLKVRSVLFCRKFLLRLIEKRKPRVILVMGDMSTEAIFRDKMARDEKENKSSTTTKWRGVMIPDREWNCWIFATYSPNLIAGDKVKTDKIPKGTRTIFFQDMLYFRKHYLDELPKYEDEKKRVKILNNEIEVLELLSLLKNRIVIDYETTGLKPYRKGQTIISCAIATSPLKAFAFLLTSKIRKKLREVLRDKKIKKVAANIKFEEIWSRADLHTRVRGWDSDTMLNTHVLDNRRGICGMKYQAYVKFGVLDYSREIGHLLRSVDEDKNGANSFNRIKEIPTEKLLLYNGLDAIYEYMLLEDQEKQFERLAKR